MWLLVRGPRLPSRGLGSEVVQGEDRAGRLISAWQELTACCEAASSATRAPVPCMVDARDTVLTFGVTRWSELLCPPARVSCHRHTQHLLLSPFCVSCRRRPDVLTVTSWLAPVLWEDTFSRPALQRHYSRRNLTVGLAVFTPSR